MEQRASLITLGVGDLQRARAFYQQLGWHGQEVEGTVSLQAGGLAIVLWARKARTRLRHPLRRPGQRQGRPSREDGYRLTTDDGRARSEAEALYVVQLARLVGGDAQ